MVKLKYITFDKLNLEDINSENYLCDDMSVKQNEKTYSKYRNCMKNNPKFGYIQLYYNSHPQIYITTPPMKCLFGIQKSGSNFQMSLQFNNLKEDDIMKYFFDFIQGIEFKCMEKIGLLESDAENFISQIKYDKQKKYDPNLSVKIPFSYNKFQTEIYSDDSDVVNLFQIQNFTPMECDIYLDKIWKMNEKYYAKWKCKTIHLL